MNTPLSTFPSHLLRLILCGGGGLPPAWGPLADADGALCSWHPYRGEVFVSGDYTTADPMLDVGSWSLPLDDASPWVARLATVAAWMLGRRHIIGTSVEVENDYHLIMLSVSMRAHLGGKNDAEPMFMRGHVSHTMTWGTHGAACDIGAFDLPTLPTHLAVHSPVVALLLALYDVPEIRARVHSVNS